MKKLILLAATAALLATSANAGCRNITVTGADGIVQTILICD